jgi:hypothetical protein
MEAPVMKRMPNGLADFVEIRQNGYFYADKTRLLYNPLQENKPYFLSRPRRFGKTPLVSALEAILQGRRELFEGLWIARSDYDSTPRPVIRMSYATVKPGSLEALNQDLLEILEAVATSEGLPHKGSAPGRVFKNLIDNMRAKHDREVAILVDEYDAPIRPISATTI